MLLCALIFINTYISPINRHGEKRHYQRQFNKQRNKKKIFQVGEAETHNSDKSSNIIKSEKKVLIF